VKVPCHQQLAGQKKSSRLYDSVGFRVGGRGGDFPRNLLGGNRMRGKNASFSGSLFSVNTIASLF
jgi:hypothetical protein